MEQLNPVVFMKREYQHPEKWDFFLFGTVMRENDNQSESFGGCFFSFSSEGTILAENNINLKQNNFFPNFFKNGPKTCFTSLKNHKNLRSAQ